MAGWPSAHFVVSMSTLSPALTLAAANRLDHPGFVRALGEVFAITRLRLAAIFNER